MSRIGAWTRVCATVLAVAAAFAAPLAAQPGGSAIVDRVRIDTRKQIDFHAAAFPETVYVGQQTTYQLGVFLTNEARNRLRRNPEFIAPEFRKLLTYELGRARRVAVPNAPTYEALVFQRALFPVAAGAIVVPAPQLSYAIPQSSSYFSREERHLVRAESAQLIVRPLPEIGQPAGFTGAVGVLSATARVDTLNARVGDPLVLTVEVVGTGNVKLLPRPTLEVGWAAAVPGTERVQVDSSGPLVRGTKEFEWVLTPSQEGRVTLPSIRYDYFDPYKREYVAARTLPIDLDVRSGALAVAETGESAALLPLRATAPPSMVATALQRNGRPSTPAMIVALAIVLVAPVPAFVMLLRRRSAARALVVPPRTTMETLRGLAPSEGDTGEGARRARRAFHVALAARLGVAPQELVSRRQVRRVLRRRGVTREGTDCVLELLDDLDAHGFANGNGKGSLADAGEAAAPGRRDSFVQRVTDCYAVVDGQAVHESARRHSRMRTGTGLGVLLCCGTLLIPLHSVVAQPDETSRDAGPASGSRPPASATGAGGADMASLQEATAVYQRRMFTDAQARFADLARANPDDADLLVNWGTAAWSAGDTVTAVIAWQRAARLLPLADDIQQRLNLLPAGARAGVASVPMIPVPLLRWAAIALWVTGWGLATWVMARPSHARQAGMGRGMRGAALLVIVVASGTGALSVWGQRVLDASDLSVVVRPVSMYIAPGTDADAMGGVTTGDVVERLEEQGEWQRVEHADGRTGWLPSLRLVSLSADDTQRALPDTRPAFEPALSPLN